MMYFKIVYTGAIPPAMRKRDFNRVVKHMFGLMARKWHREYRLKHFTHAGAQEYGYTPRSGEQSGIGTKAFFQSYTGAKKKRLGYTPPLVWSGKSRTATGASR